MSKNLSRILEQLDLNTHKSANDHRLGSLYENNEKLGDDKDEYHESGISGKGLCYDSDDGERPQPITVKNSDHTVKWNIDQTLSSNERQYPFESETKFSQLRKRRRSSARFLRMSGRFNEENLTDGDANDSESGRKQEQLGELFQKEIRMNAENKINSNNAWEFKLIDNIGKFLDDDNSSNVQAELAPNEAAVIDNVGLDDHDNSAATRTTSNDKQKRINFTKASCTIDASVKIYSYRVDDVYLSSYKVLANLNRSDGKTVPSSDNDDQSVFHPNSDEDRGEHAPSQRKTKDRQTIKTLEESMSTSILLYFDYKREIKARS